MLSSLAAKCQDFKVGMPVFQSFYEMKLKTSKFKDTMTKFKSQGLYIIRMKYWNASGSGSGFPPSLIPALWNIGILHHKKAKLRKHMRQSVATTIVSSHIAQINIVICDGLIKFSLN